MKKFSPRKRHKQDNYIKKQNQEMFKRGYFILDEIVGDTKTTNLSIYIHNTTIFFDI
jgi:hypothetical protein